MSKLELEILAAGEPATLAICAGEPIELQAAEGDGTKLRKFSMTAYTGAAMRLAGFFQPVVIDLAGVKVASQRRPILRDHDPGRIVGHSETIDVSERRIKVTGIVSGVGPDAQEIVALASNGFPWQASVGASVDKREFVDAGQEVKVNGQKFSGPLMVARSITLGEISFVPLGADGATSALVAAKPERQPTMFEKWLEAKGFDPATLSDAQKAALQAAWKAETQSSPEKPGDTYDVELAAIRAENARIAQIREVTAAACKAHVNSRSRIDRFDALCKEAVDGKWTIEQFKLAMIREERLPDSGPTIIVQRDRTLSAAAIEAAVCHAGGLKGIEKQFTPAALEEAHASFRHGIGLLELVSICAQQRGWRGHSVKGDLANALRAAFAGHDVLASGPSALDISGILSNVANKFVREAFMFVENTWSRISARRNVSDFKAITTYSLTGDLTYEQVAPGGEIKHGTLGEESYTNQANTYGKLLGIDRRDLINDDLGALNSAARRLGRGGALKINDVFWTAFLANSSFFTSGRGNYDDGAADTLMDLTGIANAHTLFMLLNDPDGKPTGTVPAIVLVPPQLWPAAWTLLMSDNLNLATATAASTGTKSPWSGMFRLEQSRYLANSSFTGYSAAAWYLLADPNDLPVIEMAFLNGQDTPTIETADMDFNRLGIALRGYHDFGAALQEYRGGVKMKGAA